MESPFALRQYRIAPSQSGAGPDDQDRKENDMITRRSAIARTLAKIGVAAMVVALLVLPAASGGMQTTRAADGISAQTLASVPAVESGSQMVVMRIVLDPGVTIEAHHHPGSASMTIVSGVLQTTLIRGGAAVDRNGVEYVAEIGDTMNLSAGRSISYSPHAVKTVANITSEQLVLMVSLLVDPNEPEITYENSSLLFQF